MQTKKGKEAGSITEHEFEYVMAAIAYEAEQAGISNPIFVADNASVHTAMGPKSPNPRLRFPRWAIPAKSPDMNKPAEHAIAQTKAAFYRKLYESSHRKLTGKLAQELMQAAFKESNKRSSVAADVQTCALTLEVIATPEGQQFVDSLGHYHVGTGGNWPPKRYR